jgi:hypothetical protein
MYHQYLWIRRLSAGSFRGCLAVDGHGNAECGRARSGAGSGEMPEHRVLRGVLGARPPAHCKAPLALDEPERQIQRQREIVDIRDDDEVLGAEAIDREPTRFMHEPSRDAAPSMGIAGIDRLESRAPFRDHDAAASHDLSARQPGDEPRTIAGAKSRSAILVASRDEGSILG